MGTGLTLPGAGFLAHRPSQGIMLLFLMNALQGTREATGAGLVLCGIPFAWKVGGALCFLVVPCYFALRRQSNFSLTV
jgi:hypothetical protein